MQDVIGPSKAGVRRPWVIRALSLAGRWRRRSRQRRALRRLLSDPHLLKDVGLTPGDAREYAKPFWRF